MTINMKYVFSVIGGGVGWVVAEVSPTFPLIFVVIAFILYDAWSAYQLDKRVKQRYPDRTKRHDAKFTSFAFGKVIRKTIPERLVLIMLAWMAEKYVFVHLSIPLSYIITGVILFEQAWSALENNSSCRDEGDGRFWRILQRIMIDKTERHFDISLSELKDDVTEEQIESMRQRVREWDKEQKKHGKNKEI
jgi:hypothetical protein